MNIIIKTSNIDLTPAIEEYINKRIASAEKFVHNGDTEAKAEVEIGKTTNHHKHGDYFKTEINFVNDGKYFRASAETADLYSAIDLAKDQLISELGLAKDKKLTLLRRGSQKIKNILKGFKN